MQGGTREGAETPTVVDGAGDLPMCFELCAAVKVKGDCSNVREAVSVPPAIVAAGTRRIGIIRNARPKA